MFTDLPADVIVHLTSWLSQGDILSLSQTNTYYYETVQPKLYEYIVVDSSRRLYEDVLEGSSRRRWFANNLYLGEPTVIRSLYALTRFFKTLTNHKHYGRHIRHLVVEDQLPDIPELELVQHLLAIVPTLVNLEVLNWYAVHRPLDARILLLIPHLGRLVSLRGNMQLVSGAFPSSPFLQLRQLDLSNFGSSKALQTIDMTQFPSLDSLTLAKKASPHMLHVLSRVSNCCHTALSSSSESLPFFEFPAYISTVFAGNNSILHLSSLTLRGIYVCAQDAYLLLENIHVDSLKELSLDNCGECLFEELIGIPIRRRTPPPELFLDVLAKQLTALESLNLNLCNELCYNRSTFDAISALGPLKRLGVHIKMFKTDDAINLAPLVNSIQTHCESLEYLNMCCDVVDSAVSVCPKKNNQYQLKSVLGLSNLRNLKVLKLPLTFSQIEDVANVLSALSELRILQLGITDLGCPASKAACGSCNDTLFYALYSTNCLISQDYFSCPSSFTSRIEQNKTHEYISYTERFRRSLAKLQYVRFDLKNQSLVYDCLMEKVVAKDSAFTESFDSLVHMYV